MYIPPAFAESDLATLHDFIERNSFGLLVSEVDEKPFASHLPLLLDRSAGPRGTLIGHMARANPQWRDFGKGDALVVFSGPHAYVSPTWYEAEHVVPTWNYQAVHAYGPVEVIHDEPQLFEIVERSVTTYERSLSPPWQMNISPDLSQRPSRSSSDDVPGASDTFVRKLLAQIVGFRIEMVRLEGKFKLNQNQPQERRERVAAALRAQGDENSAAIAEAIRESLAR